VSDRPTRGSDDSEAASPSKDRRARRRKPKPKRRPTGAAASAAAEAKDPPPVADGGPNRALFLVALLAGLVGIAVGWLVRDSQSEDSAGAAGSPSAAASGSARPGGSAGPPAACTDWAQRVCAKAGEQGPECRRIQKAAQVMPAGACHAALAEVPATLTRLAQAATSCDQLVAKLCADVGEGTETCKMVTTRTKTFPPERCDEMLENYDIVIGELREMEKQNAPLTPAMAAKQAAGDGPAFGPADAKVTLVEYSDFECPFCAKGAATVTQLKKRYGKVVRVVFRQFPLPMHPNAKLAAEASLEAHAQGKFWPYHDQLFASSGKLDRATLEAIAKRVGLDMTRFRKALDDHTHADQVDKDIKLGVEIGVAGTPTVIVGTQRVPDPTNYGAVARLVEEQLKAAGVEVPPEG